MSCRVTTSFTERLSQALPFGIGVTKPKHFRDMLDVVWQNRDNLGYAWKVITRGVCDGCALGVAGLHDWTITGTHLCMTRLNLLRLNTMPALDIARLPISPNSAPTTTPNCGSSAACPTRCCANTGTGAFDASAGRKLINARPSGFARQIPVAWPSS